MEGAPFVLRILGGKPVRYRDADQVGERARGAHALVVSVKVLKHLHRYRHINREHLGGETHFRPPLDCDKTD
jgi:hypothetical protein